MSVKWLGNLLENYLYIFGIPFGDIRTVEIQHFASRLFPTMLIQLNLYESCPSLLVIMWAVVIYSIMFNTTTQEEVSLGPNTQLY